MSESPNPVGRPRLHDEPMRQVMVYLPEKMHASLRAHPDGVSATVRAAVSEYLSKISGKRKKKSS